MAKEIKQNKWKMVYSIGDNYQVELKNNGMLYYKKWGNNGIYDIVKAKSVENTFGSKELFELATELGEKLGLKVS